MKENKTIAVFKGHKVRNEHKAIVRIYDNHLQPWTLLAYDEVYNKLYTIHKNELYDYVVAVLFNQRRLWTTGTEMEALFSRVPVPFGKRHLLKEPKVLDTVCFLKDEYVCDLETGELSYSEISILGQPISEKISWTSPHCCLAVTDNTTGYVDALFITIPEFSTVIMANPMYFDVKEKTR